MKRLSPKVLPYIKNMLNCLPRVVKWSPKCDNGVLGPPTVQEKHNKVPKHVNKEMGAKCEKRTSTHEHKRPSNQGNEERQIIKQLNKHTNKRTHTHRPAHIHTNKRPDHKTTSSELQTHTNSCGRVPGEGNEDRVN